MPRPSRLPLRLACCLALTSLVAVALAEEAGEPAAPVSPAAVRPPLPPRSEAMAGGLQRALPGDEQILLKSGREAALALWRPANHGTPRGVVILLPGDGETADWPRVIGPLRRGLPDHGWHTLSLTLPDPERPIRLASEKPATEFAAATAEPAAVDEAPAEPTEDDSAAIETPYLPEQAAAEPEEAASEAPEEAEPEPAEASEEEGEPEVLDLPGRIDRRIEAALELARSRDAALIVLLGHGSGAYWAARHVQEHGPGDVAHLLAIQPRAPADADLPLERLLPELGIATGDFYYKDNRAAAQQARQRLDASRRLAHREYRQIGLQPLAGDRQVEQQQLLRRVRGWLDRQY